MRLLREQATRCRDILAKLTELSASGEPFDRTPLAALIEEVVAPHRNFGVAIDVAAPPARDDEPVGARNPAILYGLGNLLENAVDFARERVDGRRALERGRRRGHHRRRRSGLRAGNHGPHRRALRHQPQRKAKESDAAAGLGLGFFIAKTLLERSGATLSFENRAFPERGAVVTVRWSRDRFRAAVDVRGVLRLARAMPMFRMMYTAARTKTAVTGERGYGHE